MALQEPLPPVANPADSLFNLLNEFDIETLSIPKTRWSCWDKVNIGTLLMRCFLDSSLNSTYLGDFKKDIRESISHCIANIANIRSFFINHSGENKHDIYNLKNTLANQTCYHKIRKKFNLESPEESQFKYSLAILLLQIQSNLRTIQQKVSQHFSQTKDVRHELKEVQNDLIRLYHYLTAYLTSLAKILQAVLNTDLSEFPHLVRLYSDPKLNFIFNVSDKIQFLTSSNFAPLLHRLNIAAQLLNVCICDEIMESETLRADLRPKIAEKSYPRLIASLQEEDNIFYFSLGTIARFCFTNKNYGPKILTKLQDELICLLIKSIPEQFRNDFSEGATVISTRILSSPRIFPIFSVLCFSAVTSSKKSLEEIVKFSRQSPPLQLPYEMILQICLSVNLSLLIREAKIEVVKTFFEKAIGLSLSSSGVDYVIKMQNSQVAAFISKELNHSGPAQTQDQGIMPSSTISATKSAARLPAINTRTLKTSQLDTSESSEYSSASPNKFFSVTQPQLPKMLRRNSLSSSPTPRAVTPASIKAQTRRRTNSTGNSSSSNQCAYFPTNIGGSTISTLPKGPQPTPLKRVSSADSFAKRNPASSSSHNSGATQTSDREMLPSSFRATMESDYAAAAAELEKTEKEFPQTRKRSSSFSHYSSASGSDSESDSPAYQPFR